jgi:hypothetical protein
LQLSQETVINLQAQVDLFNKMIMPKVQGQVTKWKHRATKVMVGASKITQATLACFLTIFVTTFGEIFLKYYGIFLKKNLKIILSFFFNSYYFIKVHVKNLEKISFSKKNEIHYKLFYCLKTNITMFDECFSLFFIH